jgi:hypothetical protein
MYPLLRLVTEVFPSETQATSDEAQIVLALEAAPVNFGVEQINPHELISASSEGSSTSEAGQISAGNNVVGDLENMQVGMALMPDNLDVDPGLQSMFLSKSLNGKQSADGHQALGQVFCTTRKFFRHHPNS